MQNNHDDHRDDMAEAFHGIANETGRSEFVKAAKAAEEAFGEDATDPLGSETWDQLRASIAELEAQLAAERERVEKAEEKSRNLQMICAWLSTEVTEGWLVRGLGVDRISIRTIRDHAIGEVIGNPDYVCPMSDWEDRALAAEAELAAERERAEKADRRADGCDSNGPHSRQALMHSLNLARDHEAALIAERDAMRERVEKAEKQTTAAMAVMRRIGTIVSGPMNTHSWDRIRVAAAMIVGKPDDTNPIARAAIAGEETA